MNNTRQQALSGQLFALGATVIWSGNFIVASGLSEIVPPVSLAFWRLVVAGRTTSALNLSLIAITFLINHHHPVTIVLWRSNHSQ
jgi:drug/metabolite transporter (DMT)-like permease